MHVKIEIRSRFSYSILSNSNSIFHFPWHIMIANRVDQIIAVANVSFPQVNLWLLPIFSMEKIEIEEQSTVILPFAFKLKSWVAYGENPPLSNTFIEHATCRKFERLRLPLEKKTTTFTSFSMNSPLWWWFLEKHKFPKIRSLHKFTWAHCVRHPMPADGDQPSLWTSSNWIARTHIENCENLVLLNSVSPFEL